MKHTIFDLETISQDPAQLLADMPAFNPDDVKLGNLKDPVKIEAKLRECEEKHRRDYIDKAALDARTCHIKLAGIKDTSTGRFLILAWEPDDAKAIALADAFPATGKCAVVCFQSEDLMLASLSLSLREAAYADSDRVITYNGHEFDLPLFFRRNWILGNPTSVPYGWRRGRYWSDRFIDLRETVSFGSRDFSTGGLAGLGKMLGCTQQKTGDGKLFGDLYQQDPIAAVEYLIADLNLIHEAGTKTGAIPKN